MAEDIPPKTSCEDTQVTDETFKGLLDSIFEGSSMPDIGGSDLPGTGGGVSNKDFDEMLGDVFNKEEEPPNPDRPPPPPSTIMNDVKKFCGIFADYDVFDLDIMMNINSAFFTLCELGVGPRKGFVVNDNDTTWSDFLEEVDVDPDDMRIVLLGVKQYVFLKTRLIFDPPSSSYVMTSIKEQIAELEWRLRELCSGRLDTESDDEEIPEEDTCPCNTATDDEMAAVIIDVFGSLT